MIEMKSADDNGGSVPLNKADDFDGQESFFKRRKMLIIIGAAILVLIIIIIVLCVCLTGGSNNSEGSDLPIPLIKSKNNIILDVHANSDDEEIFFFSNDFDTDKAINGSENFKLFVDEKEKPFKTSMKLKAGEHKVAILFNNSLHSCQNMFRNCKNIIGVRINATNDCNNTDYMFASCSSLRTINITKFENQNDIKSAKNMFSGCSSLLNLNLSDIQTNHVENMEEMFNECSSIEYINLTELKTSSVINMRRMFNGCKKLKNLDLHNFDTTYVTNMEEMFSECNSIKEIKFENQNGELKLEKTINFDTYNVTNMYHIFYGCNSLENIDVSNFILYKLQNEIIDLFGDLRKNLYLEEIYNKLLNIFLFNVEE